MLPVIINSLVVTNNEIPQYNTRQNHHLRGSLKLIHTLRRNVN